MHLLTECFSHLPGIGPATERKLWEQGIRDWAGLKLSSGLLFSNEKRELLMNALGESERAYGRRDLDYFFKVLPRDALWRTIPGHLDDIAYLDIETTGTGYPPAAHSTTITFYFRGQVYQEHEHAKKRRLIRKMESEAAIFSTFFGESFDLPFLRQEFGMALSKPHVDLCHWLKRLGFKGGLKKIQVGFPEIPSRESRDINGYDAVRLWRFHQRGVSGALETLLTYNAEDTIVLEPLLILAYNLETSAHEKAFGISHERLDLRPLPALRTRVREEVYDLLRGKRLSAAP